MKLKKILISSLALMATTSVVLTSATSCSSVSKDITDNLVDKGDSTKLSSNLTVKDALRNALFSSSSTEQFKKAVVNNILIKWYEQIATADKDSDAFREEYKKKWEDWNKDIDEAYDREITEKKNAHKSNWEYFFQNEVLDPVGGTEFAWKRSKLAEKVRTEFASLVYRDSYLALGDKESGVYNWKIDGPIIKNPTKTALDNKDNWKQIDFFVKAQNYNEKDKEKRDFALMQKKTFDFWMQKVRPISTAMSLWKHDDTDDIGSVYNKDFLPKEQKASFEFPFFSKTNNPGKNAQAKYANFSYKMKNTPDAFIDDKGLFNIRLQDTDDQSTLMITNSTTAFKELDTRFAGSVADLWETLIVGGVNRLNENYETREMYAPDITNTLDSDIMKNFFMSSDDRPTGTKVLKNAIDLKKLYSDVEITQDTYSASGAKNEFHSNIFSEKNANKYFANFQDHDKTSPGKTKSGVRYVLGAIKVKDLDFLLIRDSFGVHLVGIDGYKYIKAAGDTQSDPVLKEKAIWNAESEILKYRSMISDKFSVTGKSMELRSVLSKYFETNLDDIILDIFYSTNEVDSPYKDVFKFRNDEQPFENSELVLKFILALNNMSAFHKTLQEVDAANRKIFGETLKYVKNSLLTKGNEEELNPEKHRDFSILSLKNYENGLAVAMPFKANASNFNENKLNLQTDNYTVSELTTAFIRTGKLVDFKVFDFKANELTLNFKKDLSKKIIKGFDDLYAAMKWSANTSKEGASYYSENITFNISEQDRNLGIALNAMFKTFASTNDLSNPEKIFAYKKYNEDYVSEMRKYQEAITSVYKTKHVLNSDDNLSYFDNQARIADADQFAEAINKIYQNKQDHLENWFYNEDEVYSYSADELELQTFYATIKYLTKDHNKELIQALYNELSDGFGYVTWSIDDTDTIGKNTTFDADFTEANLKKQFGWKSNFNGIYDDVYQSKVATGIKNTEIFLENANYYRFADMPVWTNKEDPSTKKTISKAMGFLGLVTKSESNGLSARALNMLYDNIREASGEKDTLGQYTNRGTLYQYQTVEKLKEKILGEENNPQKPGMVHISSFKAISKDLNNLIESDAFRIIDNYIQNLEDNKNDSADKARAKFEEAFRDNVFKAEWFEGLNFANSGKGGIIVHDNASFANKPFTTDSDAQKITKTYAIQLSRNDVSEEVIGEGQFEAITNHLVELLGGGETGQKILRTIAIQYAMKSTMTSKTTVDVIEAAYGSKEKALVFDRRMNEQLTKVWVKNYKKRPN